MRYYYAINYGEASVDERHIKWNRYFSTPEEAKAYVSYIAIPGDAIAVFCVVDEPVKIWEHVYLDL